MKNPCSVELSEAKVKLFTLLVPAGSRVRIVRVSVVAVTRPSSSWSPCHWIVGSTLPDAGSIVCANTRPAQVLVS
jgi:hypothetical protein